MPNGRLLVKIDAIVKPKPRRPKTYKKHNTKPKEVGLVIEDKTNKR